MSSTDLLEQTLSTITNIKLDQLQKQLTAYDTAKRALLAKADGTQDARARVKVLIDGAEKLPSMNPLKDSPTLCLSNMEHFVRQAKFDPSVTPAMIQEYEQRLRNELDIQTTKYRFAELYGKLVTEWISVGTADDNDDNASVASEFVPIGREEMHEQRALWEEYAFHAKDTDQAAITAYLEELFTQSEDAAAALKELREGLANFQKNWDERTYHFEADTLKQVIKLLLRSDNLTGEKRKTLKAFQSNDVVLDEVMHVLNTRMQMRQSWKWEEASVVDVRRQLNGRYRFHLDQDLLQALLIYYIGMSWSIELRGRMTTFRKSARVWKTASRSFSDEEKRRRDYFLPPNFEYRVGYGTPIDGILDSHYNEEIFSTQLVSDWDNVRGGYGDDDEAKGTGKSFSETVQELLHLIQSMVLISSKMGEDTTVVRSDFRWFGPSMPHSSIFAVLSFFGINDDWIDLFRRILEAPIRFANDPVDATPPVRKRGTPLATPFADMLNETLLFCLDFAVNRKADGARLYRLHDDMWLFGSTEKCKRAWEAVTEFGDVVGLDLNMDKTGSARVKSCNKTTAGGDSGGSAVADDDGLPEGDVTWGFLKLDPSARRFVIDQDSVDKHIDELWRQLKACRSVLETVRAWNIYGSRFFMTNFGRMANCYSHAHLDSMLATFSRIQHKLFGKGKSIGTYIKGLISDRFGFPVDTVPDAYIYFPVSLGGLGVQNPFIRLEMLRQDTLDDIHKRIDEALDKDRAEYRECKARFEDGDGSARRDVKSHKKRFADLAGEPFMSPEEFHRHWNQTSRSLALALTDLRKQPAEVAPVYGGIFMPEYYGISGGQQATCIMHAKETLERFGSLTIIDQGLLPSGLIGLVQENRFKWEG